MKKRNNKNINAEAQNLTNQLMLPFKLKVLSRLNYAMLGFGIFILLAMSLKLTKLFGGFLY